MPRTSLISKNKADYGDYTKLVKAIDACNLGKCGDCPYGHECISVGHSLRSMAAEAIRRLCQENERIKKDKYGTVLKEYKSLIRQLREKAILTHNEELKYLLEDAADSVEYLACERILDRGGRDDDN